MFWLVIYTQVLFLGEFLFGQKIVTEVDMGEATPTKNPSEILYQTQWEENLVSVGEDDEETHFCMLMESLGANNVFEKWVLPLFAVVFKQ